jgi:chromosome transmission fidelity protein 4
MLGSVLGDPEDYEIDDFVIDDDGAGYADGVNPNGKRPGVFDEDPFGTSKRQAVWSPRVHEPFQPGSTPWQGDRRYLCLNLIGHVWTVDHETHHTVTVTFHDTQFQRQFHFTDTFKYDKAVLSAHGSLFASPRTDLGAATLYYRPHETWTERSDFRAVLPEGEEITSIALSDRFITCTTSKGYMRVYTLYLTPYRITRLKSRPAVTCAAWRDYVLTLTNGPVNGHGSTQLLYSIENVARDETCQNDDLVALPDYPAAAVQSVMWSDEGDPCIYDSTGVLLVLLHWRNPGQAKWVPLLDTAQLARLQDGRRFEKYWPVAVADGRFHCVILKGNTESPYFPVPLLSDFEFEIPIGERTVRADPDLQVDGFTPASDQDKLQESFVRQSVLASLQTDRIEATRATSAQKAELARTEIEVDKLLIQLLAAECREGEERGMKALALVEMMRDRTGRMVEAAVKVAERYGRSVLAEKIREVGEKRIAGDDDEDF